MRTLGELVGPLVRSLPDGETETNWIVGQFGLLGQVSGLEVRSRELAGFDQPLPAIGLQAGTRVEDVHFPELGYARVAAASFEILGRLKAEGVVPEAVRLQVNLPSPVTVTSAIIDSDSSAALEGEYERALGREIEQLLESVPANEVTVGWDIPVETLAVEDGPTAFTPWFERTHDVIIGRLARAAALVPDAVPLGFHVCLGSLGNQHTHVPDDARNQVELMNRLLSELPRRVDWLHAPVPRDADPERYLAPYTDLDLPEAAELYLGVVDIADGLEATRRRVSAANAVLPSFGVGTVCGLSSDHYTRDDVLEILRLHTEVAAPIAA